VSPTVFHDGPFRFFFFSREETRVHIHVQSVDAEPEAAEHVALFVHGEDGMPAGDPIFARAVQVVNEREQEIRDAWNDHFAS
jgi:hypothetical protein